MRTQGTAARYTTCNLFYTIDKEPDARFQAVNTLHSKGHQTIQFLSKREAVGKAKQRTMLINLPFDLMVRADLERKSRRW